MGGRMVDGRGRVIEVIMLNRDGTGPQPWYRVSWHHRILLGRGYDKAAELDEVLALVDAETLVEVIELPRRRPLAENPPWSSGRSRVCFRRSRPTATARCTRSSSSDTPATSSSMAAP
jgi:hypothetical protein